MPPKARYTKEGILDVAYALVRSRGEGALTARGLATALGTSTAPIFTAFRSIEEVQEAVTERAKARYRRYHEEAMRDPLPFKAAGLAYIRFAKDEPQLFRMLFMRGDAEDGPFAAYLPKDYPYEADVRRSAAMCCHDDARAVWLYNHLSVYVHGLAVLYAQGKCVFSEEDMKRMLREVYVVLTGGDIP